MSNFCPDCNKKLPKHAESNENWTVYCGKCGMKRALEAEKKYKNIIDKDQL